MGWCAYALQCAAQAFKQAYQRQEEAPIQSAKREFCEHQHDISWDTLSSLSETVIEEKQKGYAITLNDIIRICADKNDLGVLRKAVQTTLDDPALRARLDLTLMPHMPAPAPVPAGPKPVMPQPQYTAPAFAPSVPALGGSARPMRSVQKPFIPSQKEREDHTSLPQEARQ